MTPDATLIPEALIVRIADRLKVLGQPIRLRLVVPASKRPALSLS
jgi:hypothetical protein